MKYRDLLEKLYDMNSQQLACDITVEIAWENECYPAELRIAGEEHDSLDNDHPIIYVS